MNVHDPGRYFAEGTHKLILNVIGKNKKLHKSKIFGPTCDSIDLIKEKIMLPELAICEWVYVENFVAYTKAACSSFN